MNRALHDIKGSPERFVLSATKERWLAFLPLEHEVLCPPVEFGREADELYVWRTPVPGRPVSAGRIPRELAAGLLLQAAGLAAFLQAFGFWLDETDLSGAHWEMDGGRLWLPRTPAAIGRGGPGPAPAAVLAGFVQRLFGRGRCIGEPAARTLLDRLLAPDAGVKRAGFWLASVFRAFPALAAAGAAEARRRTLGYAGDFTREVATRARLHAARALLDGHSVRIFAREEPTLTPGGALGLSEPTAGANRAARLLRERHARETSGRGAVWIAVEPEGWDALSRRAFEAAARGLAAEVTTVTCGGGLTPPLYPDEWRREIFAPCGTLRAALRFDEELAGIARAEPSRARVAAAELLSSDAWAAFACDPTGDAPLPGRAAARISVSSERTGPERDVLDHLAVCSRPVAGAVFARLLPGAALRRALARLVGSGEVRQDASGRLSLSPESRAASLTVSRKREVCRNWAAAEEGPPRRIEWLLEAREIEAALETGEAWWSSLPAGNPEPWFELSARLAAACPQPLPPWLEALEAERDLKGGRPEEADARLSRLSEWPAASPEERRRAALRRIEIQSAHGRLFDAGRRAALFRREYPGAPAGETVRALRLEAAARAREGQHEAALELLDEADRVGAGLPLSDGVETALVRGRVYSLAGRFREESETYGRFRSAALEQGDESLSARFLSQEALGLADRRDFAGAVSRLEQALAVLEGEPAERAAVLTDLAGTLYHAGRPARCEVLLDEALEAAAAAGRDDLARTARANRLELWINAGRWSEAEGEAENLVSRAREERDDVRLLVALHHRSRLALRRGQLSAAARDNEDARALAGRCRDRLEMGELWLEEGDRLALEGDTEAARAAWEAAAADPPDRCDSAALAAERLAELAWLSGNGPPAEALELLEARFRRDEYSAAETTARWRSVFSAFGFPPPGLCARARAVLRARGGEVLADRAFGRAGGSESIPAERLRALRDAVARAFAGEVGDAAQALSALGLSGLAVCDADGREIARLGAQGGEASHRRLDAGAVTYGLTLSPPVDEGLADSVALVLETLLFRSSRPAALGGFAEGWGRLGIVTADPSMEEPYSRLTRFAAQPVTVLVLGESGSGKEVVARAVHVLSPRSAGPFVAVNVAAVPATLLESELFGHARGAFTGAERDRPGLLEEAARGTIFFDEIGDLPPALQAKLLRTLQEREVRRLGENRSRPLDVRVVSATSRDLEKDVEAGRFREDLFFRIHVAVIQLPPLSRRGRDVALLARHFLGRYAREYGRGSLDLSPEALAALSAHSWPGNVRELQNAMAQAAALADTGGSVGPQQLPEALRKERRPAAATDGYRSRMDAHRRDLISEALERSGGNRSRAARELGMSRQALLYLIRELNVPARPRTGH